MEFFGFQSTSRNIDSLSILGHGHSLLTFAVDNFTFGGNQGASGSSVPDTGSTFALFGAALFGLAAIRRKALRK